MKRLIVSNSATQAEAKMASTTASPCPPLPPDAAQEEGDPKRGRRKRVTEVMDQVGEERNRA
jgi:hypothetical protein